ncbi:hypothetical protein CISG_03646 [Coccidioides immitis RMSCC 3703]|uniref:Large ribosomal subunit protein bL32m n=2 Tax=Coccidioides immitis TaxID=5501 RepID=A0A0J8QQ94_COCIT|nr:hypothetical protein CIRG_04066 [Coccidioides immitis RMSCC 2394]KMU73513.1 hypothetical protein CISG_03646 [Coccidioides immitis RMSCC 3703]
MAAIRPIWASPLPHLFIRAIPSLSVFQSSTSSRLLQYLPRSFALSSKTIAPGAIVLGLPSILSGLWESILRAVPKKKTSHMKKRHRQMAGKALKDVKNMTNCPGCGQPKRAHLLCPTCVNGTFIVIICGFDPKEKSTDNSVSRGQATLARRGNISLTFSYVWILRSR